MDQRETTRANDEGGFEATSLRDLKEEARNAKRLAVLTTGARMFRARGYDRTSLDDIAAELAVSKRTLYYYIKNKDDILFQCNLICFESLQPALAAAKDPHLPPLERIRIFLRAHVEMLESDLGNCLALTQENVLTPEASRHLRENRRALDHTLRELIRQGQEDGSIRPLEPALVSAAIYGALNWMPFWRSPLQSPGYLDIFDEYIAFFLHGLAAPSAP